MIKQLLLGGAAVVWAAGSASALTMNIDGDNRGVYAFAQAGGDTDSDSATPAGSVFDGQASASASADVIATISGGGGGAFFGAVANASADQYSQIDAASLMISGSGHANASGNQGNFNQPILSEADSGAGGGGGLSFYGFSADADSTLDVLFSIDEAAEFDISGFLSAGTEVLVGDAEIASGVFNEASIILINTDTNESAYKTSVSNNSVNLDETGVIGAGNYRFTVRALAEVNGLLEEELVSSIDVGLGNGLGYGTNAGFKGVALQLTAIDQPIPEPVTTTLAAMGLGALVLRTSRRRHS